jgi:hypothetical protein
VKSIEAPSRRSVLLIIIAAAGAHLIATNAPHAQSSPSASGVPVLATIDDARHFFVCRTLLSYDPGHGTQVSYIRPDGTEFLWYPGNRFVVTGKWQFRARVMSLDPPREIADLCLQFGTNTYNPVTKQQGGQWECRPARAIARTVVERAKGDVFDLAHRFPFILPAERSSIGELRRMLEAVDPNGAHREKVDDAECPKEGIVRVEDDAGRAVRHRPGG